MARIGKRQKAQMIWDLLNEEFKQSDCTLESDSPERLAIRGILSAQCTDIKVNAVSKVFFEMYPDMDSIAQLSEEQIGELIKPCGLYKGKSKSIKEFATRFCNEWNHEVPKDVDELMKCPGIGKKIANLIVGEIYGIPAIVVDTHCKRVMYRVGITDKTEPLKVEQDMMKVFDEDKWIKIGHLSVDLGRMYCTSQRPKCDVCPLNTICGRKGV